MTGGYLGVDVFFVISGYLITSLLLEEIETTETLSISQFYLRRTRRILPALLVMCALVYLFFAVITLKPQSPFPNFGGSLIAALFSYSNIFFWIHSGYFALEAWAEPLLHTWSLGVEEQFYLVIPLLMYFASRVQGKKKTGALFALYVSLALLSFSFCRWGRLWADGEFIFYMLPSRMWELLVGAIVGLILRKYDILNSKRVLLCNALAFIGVLGMCYGFFFYIESTRIAEKALVVTFSAALFIVFANQRTFVGKVFSFTPVCFLGKVSYSWYLWHWPLVTLAVFLPVLYPFFSPGQWQLILLIVSLVLAVLSWKFVEMPFRKKKDWASCVKPLAPIFGVLLLVGIGNYYQAFGVNNYHFEKRTIQSKSVLNLHQEESLIGAPDIPPVFVLFGNSHAASVAPVVAQLAEDYGTSGVFLQDDILPMLNMRKKGRDKVKADLTTTLIHYMQENALSDILFVARWDHIWEFSDKKMLYYDEYLIGIDEIDSLYYSEVRNLLSQFTTNGINVWILEQVPNAQINPTIAVRFFEDYQEPISFEGHNDIMRSIINVDDSSKLHFLTTRPYFVKNERVSFTKGDRLLYFDDDHLSYDGALHISDVFRSFFKSVLSSQLSTRGVVVSHDNRPLKKSIFPVFTPKTCSPQQLA